MSIEAHHDTRLKSLIQANSTAMHVDLAKAVCFVIAAFVVLAPSRLTAQAPVSSVRNADSTVSQPRTLQRQTNPPSWLRS
jgi:hypothetical protein